MLAGARLPPDDPRAVAAVLDVLACVYGGALASPALPAVAGPGVVPGFAGTSAVEAVASLHRRAEQAAARLVLDRLPFALLAVDAAGTVVYANEAAVGMLMDGNRLCLREAGRRLDAAHAGDADTLRDVIGRLGSAAAETPAQTCHLTSAADGRRFGILALRAARAEPPLVVLLAADPGREQALRALLRSIFGLTRAEAELSLLMLQGLSLDEAAHARRITPSSARASWQSVTWKVGGSPPGLLLQVLQAALVLPLGSFEREPGR